MSFESLSAAEWDAFLSSETFSTNAHILQGSLWGELKSAFGWSPHRFMTDTAAAQILLRQLPLGYRIAYLPKGPIGENWQELLSGIETFCRANKVVFLQVEPDAFDPFASETQPALQNYLLEDRTIQPRGTIVIDISQSEGQLLAAMKQKTRYNLRLAGKKGVAVVLSEDVDSFYCVSQKTAERDGFSVHSKAYYQKIMDLYHDSGNCVLLEARYEGKAIAYLMLFLHGNRSWYFYGASDDDYKQVMAPYLLQWEAMRYAKTHGALSYDLWGIPDADEETLERDFLNRSDGLWGVYRFKRGFGGRVLRSAPAYIKVFNPLLYKAYQIYRRRRGADAGT